MSDISEDKGLIDLKKKPFDNVSSLFTKIYDSPISKVCVHNSASTKHICHHICMVI